MRGHGCADAPPGPTQRELHRRYKETKRPMGVYAIRNTRQRPHPYRRQPRCRRRVEPASLRADLKGHRNRAPARRRGCASAPRELPVRGRRHRQAARRRGLRSAAELAALLALWTEELDAGGERGYRRGERSARAAEEHRMKAPPRPTSVSASASPTPALAFKLDEELGTHHGLELPGFLLLRRVGRRAGRPPRAGRPRAADRRQDVGADAAADPAGEDRARRARNLGARRRARGRLRPSGRRC